LLWAGFFALFFALWGLIYAFWHAGGKLTPVLARATVRWARIGKYTDKYKAYGPVLLLLVAGAVLTALAGDEFLDLAELVHSKSPQLQQFDVRLHAWAVSHRSANATAFFTIMTIVGGPVGLAVIAVIVAAVLVVKKRYAWTVYLLITAGGGALLNLELKRYFARARPDIAEMLRRSQGYSFPSGHAMGSTVTFLALAYLVARMSITWRWKSAAIALAWTLIVSVALSRVYLGAHWTSDVVAGVAVGTIWVSVTTVAYEAFRRVRRIRGGAVSS
jgi:membrane-associated phospholipid phosphatase